VACPAFEPFEALLSDLVYGHLALYVAWLSCEILHCSPFPGNMVATKRVAIIGAGPAGAITIDALAKEKTFDLIRVFERREGPGGCW
jgi:NADPH-dependent glutamate synthase beta subunit-like oxidoreductase